MQPALEKKREAVQRQAREALGVWAAARAALREHVTETHGLLSKLRRANEVSLWRAFGDAAEEVRTGTRQRHVDALDRALSAGVAQVNQAVTGLCALEGLTHGLLRQLRVLQGVVATFQKLVAEAQAAFTQESRALPAETGAVSWVEGLQDLLRVQTHELALVVRRHVNASHKCHRPDPWMAWTLAKSDGAGGDCPPGRVRRAHGGCHHASGERAAHPLLVKLRCWHSMSSSSSCMD